jgi:hypothetical protein
MINLKCSNYLRRLQIMKIINISQTKIIVFFFSQIYQQKQDFLRHVLVQTLKILLFISFRLYLISCLFEGGRV